MTKTVRKKRNAAEIAMRVLKEAGVQSPIIQTQQHDNPSPLPLCEREGLTLGQLEDQRWGISPPVAKTVILAAGLPYQGRRARIIYSWASIFRLENIGADVAKNATRESHPELFEDLLDSKSAAEMIGYRDSSSIRKMMLQGGVDNAMYHQLVTQFGIQGFAGSAQNYHVGQCHHRLTCEVFT